MKKDNEHKSNLLTNKFYFKNLFFSIMNYLLFHIKYDLFCFK